MGRLAAVHEVCEYGGEQRRGAGERELGPAAEEHDPERGERDELVGQRRRREEEEREPHRGEEKRSRQVDPAALPSPGAMLAAISGDTVGGERYDKAWPERAAATLW